MLEFNGFYGSWGLEVQLDYLIKGPQTKGVMHLEIAVIIEKESSLTDIFTIIIYLSSYLDCYFNVMS